jgi:tripartite-type tricarboxylate transporter receptor subunit TctC
MKFSRRHVLAATALFAGLAAAPSFAADAWPSHPIRFVAAAIDHAMKDPATVKRLEAMGIEPVGGTRASFVKFVDDERARLGGVVNATGMRDE